MHDVALIVLAAGAASRMGEPKQLLPIGGQPMVRVIAQRGLASRCRPVVVVTGARSHAVHAALEGLPLRLVYNPTWRRGIGSSIRAGIREAARSGSHAAILTLGDQPDLDAPAWDRLAAEWENTGSAVVASSYAGTLGAPALFARALFPILLGIAEDAGCKAVIARQPREVVRHLDCTEAAVDLDTPDDYRRWRGGDD